jgi:hypothetical protein
MAKRASSKRLTPAELAIVRARIDHDGVDVIAAASNVSAATVARIAAGQGAHVLTVRAVMAACQSKEKSA